MTFTTAPYNNLNAFNKAVVGKINLSQRMLFSSEIDLTEIEKLRAGLAYGEKPSYTAFIAKAVAIALLEFPYANRRIYNLWGIPFLTFFQSFNGTDIAVAVERNSENVDSETSIEVIRNAHEKTAIELTLMLSKFSQSALKFSEQWKSFYRVGKFLPKMWSKHCGGSVLISSPANYGVDAVVSAETHPISFYKGSSFYANVKFLM